MNDMRRLIDLLESLNSMDLPDQENNVLQEPSDLVTSIVACANEVLIDANGKNIWGSHEILENYGFSVFPGEVDGFGWLTGCIQTKKGIIVYG